MLKEFRESKFYSLLKKHKRIIIGIFTIILIILMIIFVDFENIIQKFFLIGLIGTFIFSLIYTLTFIFRSYKLKLIFKSINRDISFTNSFLSIGTSFIINDITPAKIGDFAKIAILKERENITINESVGSIAAERIFDLITLFIISCTVLLYLYFFNGIELHEYELFGLTFQFYLILTALFIVSLLIFIIFLIFKSKSIIKILRKISKRLGDYLEELIKNFKIAISQFKEHKKEFLIITIFEGLIWIFESMIGVLFFYLLGFQLNIFIIILAQILKFFSKTFPITPGGWGISENLGAVFLLIFYPSIPYTEILSVFIIDHLFRSGYLFFYGGYSIFHYNFRINKIEELKTQT